MIGCLTIVADGPASTAEIGVRCRPPTWCVRVKVWFAWLGGRAVVWLCGCVVVWSYGGTVVWLCMVVWLLVVWCGVAFGSVVLLVEVWCHWWGGVVGVLVYYCAVVRSCCCAVVVWRCCAVVLVVWSF